MKTKKFKKIIDNMYEYHVKVDSLIGFDFVDRYTKDDDYSFKKNFFFRADTYSSSFVYFSDQKTDRDFFSTEDEILHDVIKRNKVLTGMFLDYEFDYKNRIYIIRVYLLIDKLAKKYIIDESEMSDSQIRSESERNTESENKCKVTKTENLTYDVGNIEDIEILQSGPIDLETTSALVYIKFVDSNGEPQRVSIMNGNMQINVVGSQYVDGYDEFEEQIKEGDTVRLLPEPTNPVDPDAIAVKWNGKHIGYVPKSRIPAVALCMDGSAGCKGVVYENNCGWVAFELTPTLQNLHNKGCLAKYGPYQFDVISNNECVTLDTAQFLQHFKIGKTKKSSLKSIATTKYAAKRLKALLKSDSKYLATFDFDSLPYSARNSSKIHKYLNLNDHELISENMEFLNCINPDSKALDYLLCKKSLPEALFFFESIRFFMSQSALKKDQLKKDKSSTPIEINTVDELLDYVKTYSEMTSDMLNVMPMIINNKFPEYLGAPGVMSNLKGLYALAVSIDQIYLDMLNLIAEIKTIKAPAAYKEVLDYIGKNTTSLIKQFEHFMKDCLDQLVYYVDHEPDPNGVEINLHYSFELDESFADRVFQMIDRL